MSLHRAERLLAVGLSLFLGCLCCTKLPHQKLDRVLQEVHCIGGTKFIYTFKIVLIFEKEWGRMYPEVYSCYQKFVW